MTAVLAITPFWGDRAMAFIIALGVVWGLTQGRKERER
jgi:hypothetical protein